MIKHVKPKRLYKPIKQLVFKVFQPGNKGKPKTVVLRPPHGRHFLPGAEQTYLEKLASTLEHEFPGHEYKLIELTTGQFNFVHVAYPPRDFVAPPTGVITTPQLNNSEAVIKLLSDRA